MLSLRFSVLVVLAAALSGCGGGDKLDLAPVSGKVTVDGAPLAGVNVQFQPQAANSDGLAPTSFGVTDAEGHYSLEVTTTGESGALVGSHQVTFSLPEVAADSDAGEGEGGQQTNGNINDARAFDVPGGGSDSANFDLTTG